jgi:hypothetical protein
MPIKRHNAAADASSDDRDSSKNINPQVNARLDAYIGARSGDFDHYAKLVRENPERAVRTLMLKDMFRHEREMKMVEKQLPEARRIFGELPKDVQAEIQKKVEAVEPMFADKTLVNEVFSHLTRESMAENRRKLMPAKAGVAAG